MEARMGYPAKFKTPAEEKQFFKEDPEMLVLSRKSGQSIRIGDEIVLTVVAINGKRAKIGIEAPAHCNIVRQEVAVDRSPQWVDLVTPELELTHS